MYEMLGVLIIIIFYKLLVPITFSTVVWIEIKFGMELYYEASRTNCKSSLKSNLYISLCKIHGQN